MQPASPIQNLAESGPSSADLERPQPSCTSASPSPTEPAPSTTATPTKALNLDPLTTLPPPPTLPPKPTMSLLAPSTWTFRYLHSTLALVAALPLLLTLVTGFAYRFSRAELHYEKADVSWLMSLHTMSTLSLHSLYPLLVALVTLVMAATGVPLSSMWKAVQRLRAGRSGVWSSLVTPPTQYNLRTLHRTTTSLLLLPLSLTAVTGALWTVQQHYLHYPREQSSWLLHLHQGDWLSVGGRGGPVLYTALLLLLTLPAVLSGVTMLPAVVWWRSGGGVAGDRGVERSGRAVKYTMLSVKAAFEGDDDDEDDGTALGMMDDEEAAEKTARHDNKKGGKSVARENDGEVADEEKQHTDSIATISR